MATEAPTTPELLAKFGPLRAYQSGQRLDTSVDPDRLVKTHCCFCGQQCGIQLKVKGNKVIGFEPWTDFPFNKGMLCPKGVRRYLQSSHHDRLTAAYFRDPTRPEGFRAVPYDEAIGRVASEIQRIQSTYGNDAFAVLGGASMTTEKCYLLGKFARVCLKTRYIDYNGRLCMVQRRGREQEGVRDRPGRQPDERHPAGRCHLDRRGERGRVRPDHHQLHLAGPRERREDHQRRSAHHPARPNLRPRAADQAGPRRRALRRRPAPDDRERLARPRLHPATTRSVSSRWPRPSRTGPRERRPR